MWQPLMLECAVCGTVSDARECFDERTTDGVEHVLCLSCSYSIDDLKDDATSLQQLRDHIKNRTDHP